jgi:tetratricopeptide (TPR) repeat protein
MSNETLDSALTRSRLSPSPHYSIEILEETLISLQHQLPYLPQLTLSPFFVELGRQYNSLAMELMASGASSTATIVKILEKSQTLSQPSNTYIVPSDRALLLSITLNNFACLFKASHKPHSALSYLKKAAVVDEDATLPTRDRVGTLLNQMVCLGDLNKRTEALKLGRDILAMVDKDPDAANIAAMVYYNAGVQYEHLKRLPQAREAYRRALLAMDSVDGATLKAEIEQALRQLETRN